MCVMERHDDKATINTVIFLWLECSFWRLGLQIGSQKTQEDKQNIHLIVITIFWTKSPKSYSPVVKNPSTLKNIIAVLITQIVMECTLGSQSRIIIQKIYEVREMTMQHLYGQCLYVMSSIAQKLTWADEDVSIHFSYNFIHHWLFGISFNH